MASGNHSDHESDDDHKHDHAHDHGAAPAQEEGCDEDGCGHGVAATPIPQSWLVALSGVMTGVGLVISWLMHEDAWPSVVAYALATLAGGLLVAPPAWKSIKRFRLDINVLMVVAVTGAWLIGEGAEAAAVIFLFSLSEMLETWSAGRARKAIAALLKLAPETALRVEPSGAAAEVPITALNVGDKVLVKSGERVPVDGSVLDGASAINQAPITGESLPVEKRKGDPVYAGTINGEGSLTISVTKTSGQSTLSRIIKLVEEAEGQKAPTQRFVDRFARVYTPAIFIAAILVALIPLVSGGSWMTWGYRSLVLLVIACPCALVIATPVSIVSGLASLARRGVLVKGGAHLEALGKLRALAVDKTGTITQGTPRVTSVKTVTASSEQEVLSVAAAIDTHSTHPIARAVVEAAEKQQVKFPAATDYRARTGLGAEGVVDGRRCFVGNHRFAHESGLCSESLEAILSGIEETGSSLAVVGRFATDTQPGGILGVIAVGDAIRPEAADALKKLHATGVIKVVMLSGDNQRTANAIAQQAGIDEAHGDLLPEQKVEQMKRLVSEYKYVGMIGDGVNDAPALAVASVGFAMGAIGSDAAIETADVALMKDDLSKVAEAIHFGQRTMRVIQFNVAFAIAIKVVFLVLAMTGRTSLWLAILADTGATLLVILNALRLLRGTPMP
jgi:Cd2+/Zn2+-exporting ATPase